MNHYKIDLYGVTYHVEPLADDGELFAVIHRVDGLEQYGPGELPAMFDLEAHDELAKMLGEVLRNEAEVV